jgi:coproporphyrinogen III oxidase
MTTTDAEPRSDSAVRPDREPPTGQALVLADLFTDAQRRLVDAFEELDGAGRFATAPWNRDGLGRGRVRILENGRVFERAGVNVSVVRGRALPPSVSRIRPDLTDRPFLATGISMVLHPVNPYAPSFHANFRYFEVSGSADAWWFGGGADLTPMYGFDEDAVHFHRTWKDCCDRHDPDWYAAWKRSCDEYFFIPHRREMRGIGGIFFEQLTGGEDDRRRYAAFLRDALTTVVAAYVPLVARRSAIPYGDRERAWQLLRRGRYVEFNLVYDRGTRFGLQTGGNIEAILMAMPPMAHWAFDVRPEPGSAESTVAGFLQPRDWAGGTGRPDSAPAEGRSE